jgi:Tol biopolymer transport system component
MLSPVPTANVVDLNGSDSWGLGFALKDLGANRLLVSHGGGGCCNKALLSFLPESGDGLVILTNGTQGHMLMEHVQCEWLAWTQGESGEGCGGLYDIFTMTADGTDLRRVLSDPHSELLPHWSPDGSSIAFSSSRNFNQDIYTANTVDWQQRRLTTNSSFDASPFWSPDGSRIAFTRVDKGVPKIYSMKPDGSNQKRLSRNPGDEILPSWSPDGRRIVFAGNAEPGSPLGIWIINADGNGLRRLGTMLAGVGAPAWSPDGLSIAFSSGGDITSLLWPIQLSHA